MLEKIVENSRVLDYKLLSPGYTVNCVAKLVYFKFGNVADSGVPYVILGFRDVNGVRVSGIIFDINPNVVSAKLKPLKGKVVRIYAVTSLYRDAYSLRFSDIDSIGESGTSEFDNLFSEEVSDVEGLAEEIRAICLEVSMDYTVPFQFTLAGYEQLYGGLRGGAVKFMNDVVRASTAYLGYKGIETTLFMSSLIYSLEIFLTKLELEDKAGFADTMSLMGEIYGLKAKGKMSDREFSVVFDCCCSVVGISAGNHPYSMIIREFVNSTFTIQNVVTAIPTMVIGEGYKVGDTRLTNF